MASLFFAMFLPDIGIMSNDSYAGMWREYFGGWKGAMILFMKAENLDLSASSTNRIWLI